MNWLEKIRAKPQEQKIRLVWSISAMAALLLIGLWMITAPLSKRVPKEGSLWDTAKNGFQDIKNHYRND